MLQGTQSEWIAFLSPMADCRFNLYWYISRTFSCIGSKEILSCFLADGFFMHPHRVEQFHWKHPQGKKSGPRKCTNKKFSRKCLNAKFTFLFSWKKEDPSTLRQDCWAPAPKIFCFLFLFPLFYFRSSQVQSCDCAQDRVARRVQGTRAQKPGESFTFS